MSDQDQPTEGWESYVEVISEEQLRQAVNRSLAELGVTFEQLAEQARRGWFQSNHARLVWMGIPRGFDDRPRGAARTETYTCEACGETYDNAWSDADAIAEAVNMFTAEELADGTAVVCDDCWNKMMGKAPSGG